MHPHPSSVLLWEEKNGWKLLSSWAPLLGICSLEPPLCPHCTPTLPCLHVTALRPPRDSRHSCSGPLALCHQSLPGPSPPDMLACPKSQCCVGILMHGMIGMGGINRDGVPSTAQMGCTVCWILTQQHPVSPEQLLLLLSLAVG